MNKYLYLLKNIGLLTLSKFTTNFLSFFLVPLYTNILSTSEYGTYDLFLTTIGVLLPILTLNIQEGILRFALDKKTDRKIIVSTGIKYLLIANFLVILGLIANNVFVINQVLRDYYLLFFLMFFSQSVTGVLTSYARGVDKIYDLSVSSVISSFFTIILNIFFLVVVKLGLVGYFLANILGPIIQCIYLLIKTDFLKHISLCTSNDSKQITDYSKPLIANGIAWWVNSVSDRYIVTFFCGLAANGIYSIAGKIPSILNIFQSIFNQAWTLSAVKDYDRDDKNGFFSITYKSYNCFLVILCSGIIMFDKLLARVLYAKDFYAAWAYVPWLTMSIIFGALSGYLGGFFSAVKDSKMISTSTIIGAIINLLLNIVFTPYFGAMGASLATYVSYVVVWAFRYIQSKKYIKLQINMKRDIFSYGLLVVQSVMISCTSGISMYIIQIIIFVIILACYMNEIISLAKKIIRRR